MHSEREKQAIQECLARVGGAGSPDVIAAAALVCNRAAAPPLTVPPIVPSLERALEALNDAIRATYVGPNATAMAAPVATGRAGMAENNSGNEAYYQGGL